MTGGSPSPRPLLVGDAIVVLLLLNEARRRIVARVFGVSGGSSIAVSVVVIGLVAKALHASLARVRRVLVRPSLGDAIIGGGAVKEITHRVAGDWSRDTPFFGGMVIVAVLDKSFGPMLRGAYNAVQGALHTVMAWLHEVRVLIEGR